MSHFDRSCRDFAIAYLGATIMTIVMVRTLDATGIAIVTFAGLVPATVAGLLAGARHAARTGETPGTGMSWAFGLCGAAMSILVTICLCAVALMSPEPQVTIQPLIVQPAVIGMLLAVIGSVHLLALRYLFALAAVCVLWQRERGRTPGFLQGSPSRSRASIKRSALGV